MAQKREHLEQLLKLIDGWANEEGNEWFKKELTRKYVDNHAETYEEKNKHYLELKRTRYFLKNIDNTYYKEGRIFYNNCCDSLLKHSLCSDFKLMKIAEAENNVVEFGRFLILQIENALNFIINKLDVYQIIADNPNKYKSGKVNLIDGNFSFFSNPNFAKPNSRRFEMNGQILYSKDITNIDVSVKISFARIYYNLYYEFNDFVELNFLRNKASHRGSTPHEIIKLQAINSLPFSVVKSKYFRCFLSIITNLKDIYK